jgi:hypothetical protein
LHAQFAAINLLIGSNSPRSNLDLRLPRAAFNDPYLR